MANGIKIKGKQREKINIFYFDDDVSSSGW